MSEGKFQKAFLILLVVGISAAFVAMIRNFLLTILLAAIFAGLFYPLFDRLSGAFRGRRIPAAIVTLVVFLIVIVGPLLTILGIVANEAFKVSEAVRPWIEARVSERSVLLDRLEALPGFEFIRPYRTEILTKAGELVGSTGTFLFNSLSATTRGTVAFLFQFFVFLYTMFFLLLDGKPLLEKITYYMPLPPEDEKRMADKFVSVTRATIKGTMVIGIVQGGLAGMALWAAGVHGAFFWGTIMVVLSIIPGVGTALVWVPAAIILGASGKIGAAIGLTLFCALVVGSVDNLLRPRLVGRDTEMHDLLIFFSTLGGILLFGVLGFIVGPILAALFVTIWEIYGIAFRDVLPR